VELPVRSISEIDKSLENFDRSPGGGIVVIPDTFMGLREVFGRVIAVAGRDRVPAVFPFRYMAKAGGLMSYGIDKHRSLSTRGNLRRSYPQRRRAR
jgi:putative ABC transport system substrate-binding protein